MLDNVMLYWLHRHRRVVGPAVLGELHTRLDMRPDRGARRAFDLPEGDLPAVAALGRDALHRPALLRTSSTRGGHFAAFEQPASSFVDEVRGVLPHLRHVVDGTPHSPRDGRRSLE